MANNTISQLEINGTTYDILDASTRDAVSALDTRVTTLENSVDLLGMVEKVSFNLYNEPTKSGNMVYWLNNDNKINLSFNQNRLALNYIENGNSERTLWEMPSKGVSWKGTHIVVFQFDSTITNNNYHAFFHFDTDVGSYIPRDASIVINQILGQIGLANTSLTVNDFTIRNWWGVLDVYTTNNKVVGYPVAMQVTLT